VRDRSNEKEYQSYGKDLAEIRSEIWHARLSAQLNIAQAIGVVATPLRQETTVRSDWKVKIEGDESDAEYFKQEYERVIEANRDIYESATPRSLKKSIEEGTAGITYPRPLHSDDGKIIQSPNVQKQPAKSETQEAKLEPLSVEEKLEALQNEEQALIAIGYYHQKITDAPVRLRTGMTPLKEIMAEPMPQRRPGETFGHYLRRCSPIQNYKAIAGLFVRSTDIPRMRKSGKYSEEVLDARESSLVNEFLTSFMYFEPTNTRQSRNPGTRKRDLDRLLRARKLRRAELKAEENTLINKRTGQYILDISGATKEFIRGQNSPESL
jgi:hypothetical protein